MPPKARGDLLFINKTSRSTSLSNSRSDSANARRINKHVQSTRDLEKERKARRERRRAGLQRSLPSPTDSNPGTESTSFSPPNLLPTPPPDSPDEILASSSFSQGTTGHSDVEEITPTSLATMIPSRGSVEPFDVVKVPLDNEKYHILQYFVLHFFPAVTRSDTGGFISTDLAATQIPALQMMQDSLSHPMHTFALLTGTSARMRSVTGTQLSQTDLTEQFADTAIRMLREYMAEGREVNERLLQSMFYLLAQESYNRNWAGVNTHLEMIKYLYTTYMGGFRNLNVHLRKMLWFADRFQASATAKPPLIEESWQAEDITTEQFETISKAIKKAGKVQMGSAFFQYANYFSTPFRKYLKEVMELASVIQAHWTHVNVEKPDRDWVIGRSFTMSDHLLYFKSPPGEDQYALPVVLQDCIRLAIIVWLAFIPSPRTGVSPQTSSEIKIRAAVDARPLRYRYATLLGFGQQDIPEAQQNDIDKLFLWIAGVGSLASELEENQQWFMEHFGRLAKKLGINSWSAFAPVDRSFLWLDRLESLHNSRLTLLLLTQAFDHG